MAKTEYHAAGCTKEHSVLTSCEVERTKATNCPRRRFLFWTWTEHDWETTWTDQMNWDLPEYHHQKCRRCPASRIA